MSAVVSGKATYFDGLRAEAREVIADVRAEGIALTFEDRSTAFWLREHVLTSASGSEAGSGLILAHRGDGAGNPSVVLEDRRLVQAWQRLGRRAGHVRPILDPGDGRRSIVIVVAIVLTVLLIAKGLPALGRVYLPLVPLAADRALGRFAIGSLREPGTFEVGSRRVRALEGLLAKLTEQLEQPRGFTYRLTFLTDPELVNAFALPGGEVVVSQGIVSLAPSAEALAGVLAHEIQHVEHRHGTTAMLQALFLALFLQATHLGDLDLLQKLAQTSYGRDLERQADREGVDLLLRARIDPAPLVDLFERMEQRHRGRGMPAWLSDHPTVASRIAAIRARATVRQIGFEALQLEMPWAEIQAPSPSRRS
ncbi:MAG: M48 family metallopeptidase [bacterium]|nr:M48 family metallopeptidase [bacterium]